MKKLKLHKKPRTYPSVANLQNASSHVWLQPPTHISTSPKGPWNNILKSLLTNTLIVFITSCKPHAICDQLIAFLQLAYIKD